MSKRPSRDSIEQFHDLGLYLPSRTIYFGGEVIDDEGKDMGVSAHSVSTLIKNLKILESQSQDPITIIMNSPGGDVTPGIAAYDFISNCKSHVKMIVYGEASSMASIMLQACDERVMSKNSVLLIHYGFLSTEGHPKTVEKIVAENKRTDSWMEKIYLEKIREKNPKYKIGRLKYLLDHDTYLSAQQAVEIGLADSIIGE